jgi:hypothetical protein
MKAMMQSNSPWTGERIDDDTGEKFAAVWKMPDSNNECVIIWMIENNCF